MAFASEERAFAQVAVLRLAQKYRQKAIYAYRVEDGAVVREVVWVDPTVPVAPTSGKEKMRILEKAPSTPLAATEWEQPDDPAAATPAFPPSGANPGMFKREKRYDT